MEQFDTNLGRIDADLKIGLNKDQVDTRIAQGLTNKVKNKTSKSYAKIFIDNFCTFFNLLCFACFFVLLCVADNTAISNYAFVVLFVLNAIIGVVQEIRAKRTVERLSLVKAPTARVLRDGNFINIGVSDVVLDDIMELSSGDQVPADCIVVDGQVEANESLLTGESVPIKKSVGDTLLSGSFLASGKCLARADKVGTESYVQKLTEKAKVYQKTNSQLLNSLNNIIKIISILIIPIAIGAGIVNNYVITHQSTNFPQGAHISEVVISTISVIIGMIPAGMFFLTTLSLAVGIIKLANLNTLVQDMYSLEMLARVNLLCLDKTGTITDGNMVVQNIVSYDDQVDIPSVLKTMEATLKDANQTAEAIIKFSENSPLIEKEVVYTLPFNSSRKYSAVAFDDQTYLLGAPSYILQKMPEEISAKIQTEMRLGRRVVLLAKIDCPIYEETFSDKTVNPVALIILEDNIRPEAIETIKWFKENDVSVRVISGDDPVTVSEIARRAGVDNYERYVNLYGKSDEEVVKLANKYVVFGRVSPEQKALIIKTLKQKNNTVGMTGDGVNDILAMKEADCSITVASGSSASRNLAHLVLLDNNFNSLPQVVNEGRRVVNNIQRSASLYLMKTIFTMIFAVLSIATVTKYPFTTGMMLMLEFFIIGIPSVVLSLQPNSNRIKGRFTNYVLTHAIPGALILVLNALIIKILFKTTSIGITKEYYATLLTVALTLGGWTFLTVLCHPFDRFRGWLVAGITVLIFSLCAIILTTDFLQGFFGLPPLTPIINNLHLIGILIVIVLIDFPILIITKRIFKV